MKLFAAVAIIVFANTAYAQDATSIPFAPTLPASFFIDTVSTQSSGQGAARETHVSRARYRLELHSRAETFEATWTVLSADFEAPGYGHEAEVLVGYPIELTLSAQGEPSGLHNWAAVRGEWLRRIANDDRLDRMAGVPELPERFIASSLAPPLAVMSPCQDVNETVGQPRVFDREHPVAGRDATVITHISRELHSINHADDTAEVVFTRSDEVREGPSRRPGVLGNTMHIECVVDLRSGVVRSAVLDVTPTDANSLHIRTELTVTPAQSTLTQGADAH